MGTISREGMRGRIPSREIVPAGWIFPPFSFLAWKILNVVPRGSRVSFSQRERIDLHRWMGTISREAAFFADGLLA